MSNYSSKESENLTTSIPNEFNDHKVQPQEEEEDEEVLTERASQIATGITFPMVLKSAMELNILEILSERGDYMSAAEVVGEIPGCVNPHAPTVLDRMLCVLTSFNMLKCKLRGTSERVFATAPICKYFLTNKVGVEGSSGPLFLLQHDHVFLESWKHFNHAVLEGGTPFQKAYGMTPFEYTGIDSRFNDAFNRAMSNYTIFLMNKILDVYRGFEDINVLVDVGGGIGATLNLITSKYRDMKGVNFDLSYVLADAPTMNPRVEHVGGDMFDKVPNGDAIFMKWILHDWSDEHCVKLLKNCWKALPENGKVIIVESIIPLIPENNYESQVTLTQDLTMFTHHHGKERTKEEFEFLALESRFSSCHVICSVYNCNVIEFHMTG